MEMIPCDSAAIHSHGYDPETGTLAVKFHGSGGTYHYAGVSQRKWEEFQAASSKGKHFQKHIRTQHVATKVG